MWSFLISAAALILGYFIFGRYVEKVFKPDVHASTPAVKKNDGVDFVPMPAWKVYMIQFLNIAGTGPIFGAIMGARFGPSSYLWIVFGCIFAGAVHDYFSGMLSLRCGGANLPAIVERYMGKGVSHILRIFSVLLLLLVGAVFVYSPAMILGDIAPLSHGASGEGIRNAVMIWAAIIFLYYVVATLLPIDKIIGKLYPVFAIALIFMAVSLAVCLVVKWPSIPEVWDGLQNRGPSTGLEGQSIFPYLFITIACGAISGFHATQSPMMARCLKNEKLGRPIFYGAMITEGLVALVWAAVGSYFFFDGGAAEVGGSLSSQAPSVVTLVSRNWLGVMGGILAILGVVAAPITSGDTALRSARLIIADFVKLDQRKIGNRLIIAVPMFVLTALLLWFNISDANGFNTIWRYFGWANQTLACFTLWSATVWLSYYKRRRSGYYFMTLFPACFMTSVTLTYLCVDKIGFGLPHSVIPYVGTGIFVVSLAMYYIMRISWDRKHGSGYKP